MEPSSRTPEGLPDRCPVCGNSVRLVPSIPPGDAPCPYCGHLLWFGPAPRTHERGGFFGFSMDSAALRETAAPFSFDTLRNMLAQACRLGPLAKDMRLIPGLGGTPGDPQPASADRDTRRIVGMIDAMTREERCSPALVEAGRRSRIALGAGVEPHEVDLLLKCFEQLATTVRRMREA